MRNDETAAIESNGNGRGGFRGGGGGVSRVYPPQTFTTSYSIHVTMDHTTGRN